MGLFSTAVLRTATNPTSSTNTLHDCITYVRVSLPDRDRHMQRCACIFVMAARSDSHIQAGRMLQSSTAQAGCQLSSTEACHPQLIVTSSQLLLLLPAVLSLVLFFPSSSTSSSCFNAKARMAATQTIDEPRGYPVRGTWDIDYSVVFAIDHKRHDYPK